ncbi:hypothetical protein PHLGIDRAFT_32440 [Phlebiopsis gigantea 11061_1 CR5-6]|uniref:Uncharacterized protein n=1 Tax=Phlebiopsis gigantea (strain 11061_1 CR5-6) TaxID=745531 RepID=A0A0C3RQ29_PHLG1|nr:hypothetical protein PHLGIDRAFT_32440 [Phlebiopsis gigantea 11061_1 CR5-6]
MHTPPTATPTRSLCPPPSTRSTTTRRPAGTATCTTSTPATRIRRTRTRCPTHTPCIKKTSFLDSSSHGRCARYFCDI